MAVEPPVVYYQVFHYVRSAPRYYTGTDANGTPQWEADDRAAVLFGSWAEAKRFSRRYTISGYVRAVEPLPAESEVSNGG